MKRFTPTLLTAILLLLAPSVFAQEIAAHSINASLPLAAGVTSNVNTTTTTALAHPDAKLTGTLARHFPQATQQQWWQHGDGFYVQFLNNGQKARAVLNKKAALQYAITDCSLDQLPQLLRKTMADEYEGYTLKHAIAINAHSTVAYQAVLENEQGYITLKATGDQVEAVDKKAK